MTQLGLGFNGFYFYKITVITLVQHHNGSC